MKRSEKRRCKIWRDYWHGKAEEILQWDSCYIKEKYWRVDCTYYWDRQGVQDRLFNEVEFPSEDHCQYCNRGGTQYRMEYWWIVHLCWRCMIIDTIYLFFKKVKRWISESLKSLKDLTTHHTD